MTRIVVDPLTRIEGHLRIEAEFDGSQVTDAWSSCTAFRGIEIILKGRDPRDAWIFTQRICGVCTTVHAMASVRAVEDALGIEVPENARVLRNLIIATQYVHDHPIHFYHLHALDWVDITSALKADPGRTSDLAQTISDWPLSSRAYFKTVQERLKGFVERGQLGPFANAYWGHPAYRLPPEANLLAVAHYLEALDWQKEFIKVHAILGGKNPHIQSLVVGGVTTPVDPNSQSALNADTLARLKQLCQKGKEFVEKVYLPDLLAVASYYKEWASIGAGHKNYLCCGDLPLDGSGKNLFFPGGVVLGGNLNEVFPFDPGKVTESVTHSWYEYDEGESKHPWDGETRPKYTGPQPPYEYLHTDGKYSWLKSPRYEGRPMEVGPLARMLVAYAAGVPKVKELVDGVLGKLDVGPSALFSTLGRVAARGIETLLLAGQIPGWLDELASNMKKGDLQIHKGPWDPSDWPKEAQGAGFHEAPRGMLGHWVRIRDKKIENYQCVVPSTWNAGPRDSKGARGPYEESLIGTPVADAEKPVEILRTIHSFDPCMACAAHLVDKDGKEIVAVRVV